MSRELPDSISIGGRRVGPDEPCYVIAEAGANHNRDLALARQLIEIAAEAGADAVKFQTYTGASLYSSKTPQFKYLDDERPPAELLDAISLPRDWQPELRDHASDLDIHFFSSPFDQDAVDGLAELGVPALKIASFEIVDLPLIRYAASTGLPLIISTGMATYGEVEDALDAAVAGGASQVALLRCASVYPAPPEIINLSAMATMRHAFGVPVGLSDHTEGIAVATGGAALGMQLLEKHFTTSRALEGPDHPFALEPDELRTMVTAVREVESALGNGRLEGPSEPEAEEMYTLARRSIVAARDIPAGATISSEMLTTKRPGWGIKPKHLDLVVGRTARVDIEFDDVITWEMV
jgi:N,N'-diacetyllegionaminate synthase